MSTLPALAVSGLPARFRPLVAHCLACLAWPSSATSPKIAGHLSPASHPGRLHHFRPAFVLVLVLLAGCATTPTYHDGETLHGLASWYGAEQGRQTASGEEFDPRDLTAAHRHLPFGTIVRVTNRLNGDSVDVRINDRGPFADDDRIIDVSSAAADVLQMKRAGVVPVEVEVIRLGPFRHRNDD